MKNHNLNLKLQIILYYLLLSFLEGCSSEERAFQKAEEENTIPALEQFLKKYPKGKHRNEALGHLNFLYFAEATQKNTISAYEDYLKRFPQSKLQPQAVSALMTLLEPEVKKLSPEQISKLRAVIKTDLGEIRLRFHPEKAPESCRNFIKLARAHFYDQTPFHLIIPGVLVQGGAPDGELDGGPGYFLKAEFNDLVHLPGAVGMARRSHPDSAGSQFYICLIRIPERDGKYTIFAEVEQGLEVAEKISAQASFASEALPGFYQPQKPVYIRTVEILQLEPEK